MHLLRDPLSAPERAAGLTTLVVGVGSPFGDDRVGWEVVEALVAQPWWRDLTAQPVAVHACDRPGAALVGMLHGAGRLMVVDAARMSDETPGALRWLQPDELSMLRGPSSHGFGVAEALALAGALGELPRRVDLLAIAAHDFQGTDLSMPVRAAVPAVLSVIRRALLGRCAEPPRPDGCGT